MSELARRFGFVMLVAASATLIGAAGYAGNKAPKGRVLGSAGPAAAPPAIAVAPLVPNELNPGTGPNSGAPGATLAQAAAFAWQEFIGLSWPAATQDSQGNPQRDTQD